MNWQPKKTKYNKVQKKRIKKNYDNKANNITHGYYAIQSLEPGKINGNQLEAVRRIITNRTKRQVKIWIRSFPNIPLTRRPISTRMGKGKGMVSIWINKITSGTVLLEVDGKNHSIIEKALFYSLKKLPFKTTIIKRYINIK